ncbi:hypothetical protein MASR1M60_16050 [Rhodocyclaceae bacterium]
MAVHPYNTALALMATHRPLFQYLEQSLQRPVEFYTAPSFEAYVTALLAGEYDIPISPPHFAMLGVEKGLYTPLAHFKTSLDPLLVVKNDSPYQRPADFAGKRIAMADKSALIRIVMVKWLADAGLVAGKHYQIMERPTHGASISATVLGDADAGLATSTALRQVPADLQQQLRTLPSGYKFPHLITLANRRLGESLVARIKMALLSFTIEQPEGKLFYEKTGYGGYDAVTASDLAALKPFLESTRQIVDGMR